MPDPAVNPAVFLSYAREDTDAARRIADALRGFGVEVWFDQNELRGGDQWDAKIRTQIKTCALFVPIVSQSTEERPEGYFRREWKIAIDRTQDMGSSRAFIVPVVIDDTKETGADVPEEFLRYQWTRLAVGEPTPDFVALVKRLLEAPKKSALKPDLPRPAVAGHAEVVRPGSATPATKKRLPGWMWGVAVAVLIAAGVGVVVLRQPAPPAAPVAQSPSLSPSSPLADKSIAVLAFADMSADKGSEYFADGISEELLNVLAKVPGLRVAARTSAFFFKGKQVSIKQVATELGVAYVVEGSVRRAGDQVRITAQLIKADDGFHVWSDNFDRDLKNIFAVQDEIAGLIAKQLSLKLGASSGAAKAAVKPEALELYLRARQAWNLKTPQGDTQAEEALNRAIALEPNFAQAYALLAQTWTNRDRTGGIIGQFGQRTSPNFAPIQSQIDRALALEPNLAEAHTAQGALNWQHWKFDAAERELRLAIALNPSDATAHQSLGRVLLSVGRMVEGEAALQRAAELDPLSHRILDNRALPLRLAGRFAESLAFEERAIALQPDALQPNVLKARDLSELGRHDEAVTLLRRLPVDVMTTLSLGVFVKAGLRAEAEQRLPRGQANLRFSGLAHLGRHEEALAALDAATLPVNFLQDVLFEQYLDPIRSDPRFVKFLATLGMTEAHARAQAWRAAHPLPKTK